MCMCARLTACSRSTGGHSACVDTNRDAQNCGLFEIDTVSNTRVDNIACINCQCDCPPGAAICIILTSFSINFI